MAHRIELMFSGDAPDDEMERARIIAHPDVQQACSTLLAALNAAGLPANLSLRSIRTTPAKQGPRATKLAVAAE